MIKVDKTTKFVSVMERIRLSTEEKQVLRWVALSRDGLPPGFDTDMFLDAVVTLTEKRLLKSIINYDDVIDAELTPKGRVYLSRNPHLWNPVNWTMVAAIAACVAAIAGIAALFISCSLLNN